MRTVTAKEAKDRLGQYMREAAREPILVQIYRRPTTVILSYEEYERLTQLEDDYWAVRAQQAEESGYLGEKATKAFLKEGIKRAKAGHNK
jgi:prevent-host-death family protein